MSEKAKKLRASLGPLVKVSKGDDELSLQLELTQNITVHSPAGDKYFERGSKLYFNTPENHYGKQEEYGKVESAADAIEALASRDRQRSKNDAGVTIKTLRFGVLTETEQKNANK